MNDKPSWRFVTWMKKICDIIIFREFLENGNACTFWESKEENKFIINYFSLIFNVFTRKLNLLLFLFLLISFNLKKSKENTKWKYISFMCFHLLFFFN